MKPTLASTTAQRPVARAQARALRWRRAIGAIAVALLVCGMSATASVALPAPQWFATGSMAVARTGHTATVLPSGKVLVTGGTTPMPASAIEAFGPTFTATAELYDPATRSWSPAASMAVARSLHVAILLRNGKVLVIGGGSATSGSLASAELYDPASDAWSPAASMHIARLAPSAMLLHDGRVLVLSQDSGEIYDPASDTWTVIASPPADVTGYTATLLADGRVLTAGGIFDHVASDASAAVYDPAGDAWAPAASMATSRHRHVATLLPNGDVLVAGGSHYPAPETVYAGAELYHPATDTWSKTADMLTPRATFVTTSLDDGRVLVVGGAGDGRTTEVYDPQAATWTQGATLQTVRALPSVTLLHDGTVLAAGGFGNGNYVASAELLEVDATPPAAPTVSATDPASPAHVDAVKVRGSAEAGVIVRLYANADCTGSPAAQGSAESFASPGLAAAVAPDSATTYRATATDRSGNVSPCSSSSARFVEDSTPPDSTIQSGPPAISRSSAASFAFATSEPGAPSSFECRFDDAPFTACSVPATRDALAEGSHTFQVRAIDAAGNVDPTPASYAWVVDTVAPVARVAPAPNPVLAGAIVTFDGSGSSDASGPITRYEWDLDADGTFETDAAAGIAHRYVDPGTYGAQLRVTDRAGRTATASVDVRVLPAPGGRRLGISIDGGARYTNDPKVVIAASAPSFAARMALSNGPGFDPRTSLPARARSPWTLDRAGADRSPRRVYARFTGGLAVSDAYRDDIVLDEHTPLVTSAQVIRRTGESAPLLRLRARDRGLSGVADVQVTNTRSRPRAAYRAVAPTIALVARRGERPLNLHEPIYVRVRDRAGNASAWHVARRR